MSNPYGISPEEFAEMIAQEVERHKLEHSIYDARANLEIVPIDTIPWIPED